MDEVFRYNTFYNKKSSVDGAACHDFILYSLLIESKNTHEALSESRLERLNQPTLCYKDCCANVVIQSG